MSESDAAPTTGPTPSAMPGAADAAAGGGNDPAEFSDDAEGDEAEPSAEELLADVDKWKRQARTNESRAKANAEKAKAFDADFDRYKAAFEREQDAAQGKKTPEQLQAEKDAETTRRAQDAETRATEAEARALRLELSDGLPSWLIGLVKGADEDAIKDEVTDLKAKLAAYVAANPSQEARRPAPDPLVGRHGAPEPGTPKEQFAAAMAQIL